ncbi:MAG: response regulator [Elusimicrobia bacterium]|nr:response regulator [Elusimicrobiota bacterium]
MHERINSFGPIIQSQFRVDTLPFDDKGKLLIVDDEPDLLEALAEHFAGLGYAVATAPNGDQALKIFRKDRPDAVLLDLHMPDLDGVSVLREMRDVDASVRIIIMTADLLETRSKLAMEEGACDFVPKPLDFEYLDDAVMANIAVHRG